MAPGCTRLTVTPAGPSSREATGEGGQRRLRRRSTLDIVWVGADNISDLPALAFGIIVVGSLVFGSTIIIADRNHNMVPTDQIMRIPL